MRQFPREMMLWKWQKCFKSAMLRTLANELLQCVSENDALQESLLAQLAIGLTQEPASGVRSDHWYTGNAVFPNETA